MYQFSLTYELTGEQHTGTAGARMLALEAMARHVLMATPNNHIIALQKTTEGFDVYRIVIAGTRRKPETVKYKVYTATVTEVTDSLPVV